MSEQKRTKQHRFVPKVLQRAFCAEKEHIWYCSRDSNGQFGSIEDRNIESTFRIGDFYKVSDHKENLSDAVERKFYGPIDEYLGRLLPDLLESLSQGYAPSFSG